MIRITQFFIKTFRPRWCAILTKTIYYGRQIKIGKRFRTDSIPRIIVDKDCKILIGDDVELRRNVEIRCHGRATIQIGHNVRIDRGVRILAANNAIIRIDDGVRIGLYSVLNGGDSIFIGKKTLISGFVYLQTSMHAHDLKTESIQNQGYTHAPITLKEDVWLGTHVVVLPNIEMGKGSIAGSNAVVTANVDEYEVVAGVPAKTIKKR